MTALRDPRSFAVDLPDAVEPSFCPQGCGGLTSDPYGGPCSACWASTDRRWRDDPEPLECPDRWHVDVDSDTARCPTCHDTDPLDDNN